MCPIFFGPREKGVKAERFSLLATGKVSEYLQPVESSHSFDQFLFKGFSKLSNGLQSDPSQYILPFTLWETHGVTFPPNE